jgi:hypothetical protein
VRLRAARRPERLLNCDERENLPTVESESVFQGADDVGVRSVSKLIWERPGCSESLCIVVNLSNRLWRKEIGEIGGRGQN